LTLRECFASGKLRRIRPDALKAKKSLEAAAAKLEEARALLDDDHNDAAIKILGFQNQLPGSLKLYSYPTGPSST